MTSTLRIGLLSTFLGACGGGGGGDHGGSGSGTLRLDADVEATPEISNASAAQDFTTEMRVRVSKAGALVSTGEVLVVSDGGEVPLAWNAGDGEWRGVQAGYHEIYVLHVTSGDDYVHDVQVDGPDVHVFTDPEAVGAVDSTVPLRVAWDRGDEAQQATIETRETDEVAIADTGEFELPAFTLRAEPDQPEEDEIRIVRSSRISPTGAVAGSELRVEIENRLELIVAPTGP